MDHNKYNNLSKMNKKGFLQLLLVPQVWLIIIVGIGLVYVATTYGESGGLAIAKSNVYNCQDSDGLDTTNKGTVDYRYKQYADKCSGSGVLEYYCDNGRRRYKRFNCGSGETCYDGKCISKKDVPPDCIDSDGGIDIFTSGNVVYKNRRMYEDKCIKSSSRTFDLKGDKVKEYYCSNDRVRYKYEYCGGGIECVGGVCSSSVETHDKKYYFSYPEDKKSGYYAIDCRYLPKDKMDHCDECFKSKWASCASNPQSSYTINEGYEEDFTYTSEYPIYGSWEIRNMDEFSGKCFVGDCTTSNIRTVMCIREDYSVYHEMFTCNKWVNSNNYGGITTICSKGKPYVISPYENPNPGVIASCKKPKILNLYYVYNEWEGYEGYDSNWKTRWETNVRFMNNILRRYNLELDVNYYEYKLDDNSNLPAIVFYSVVKDKPDILRDGDYQITILAGKEYPIKYGINCLEEGRGGGYLACKSTGTRITDFLHNYMGDVDYGGKVLIHEMGHNMGCPHIGIGRAGSLGANVYLEGIMGYTREKYDFMYECKIIIRLLELTGSE